MLQNLSLKPYRVCPDCNGKYTADSKSRKRQIPIAVLALISLGLTCAVGLKGSGWLVPAVASHVVLWVYVGYAVSKIIYVPYRE